MYYQDDFSLRFGEEVQLHDFLAGVEEREWWNRYPSKKLEILTVSGNEELVSDIQGENDAAVLMDTLKHTQLMIRSHDGVYLLGNTAIPTLCRRARISGSALSDVEKPVLADILNECLKVSKGKALLHFYEGKVRAVVSGDERDYSILHMQDVFMAASAYINGDFDKVAFQGGYTDHTITSAIWTVADEKMLNAYRDLLKQYGRIADGSLSTEIRITTSDVAASGVNVTYNIHEGNQSIVLGKGLKTIHRGQSKVAPSRLAEVEDNIQSIFQYYKESLLGVKRLFDIQIRNPSNTMKGIMESVGISKKLVAETVEKFRNESGDQPCTAYDVYCGICQVLLFAKERNSGERVLLDLEEDISKCATRRWKDYDIPGQQAA